MDITSRSTTTTMTRRGFVKIGGVLAVSLAIPAGYFTFASKGDKDRRRNPDTHPTPLASWLEIRSDNTVVVRTGRAEIGTGMSAVYAQTIAEELSVRPESITLIMADTDKTPDGGYSAGFLNGAANLRKVGAYTYHALLDLAAARLGVSAANLTVTDGIVSGGGKTISYGQLVEGQHLDLVIPITGDPLKWDASIGGPRGLDGYTVAGDPPMKPLDQYKVVGTSYPMPAVPDKVTGKQQWSCDLTLPGMLHARMVRPVTLGSTLVSLGTFDKTRFPTADVVTKANLVAVVSPNEWEAVSAAQAVAATTKWSDWSGLPGSENLTKTLRAQKWGEPAKAGGTLDEVNAAFGHAVKTITSVYEQPYTRHAPIAPYLAVADVRPDGSATVYTHSSNSQGLRARMAYLLDVPIEKVVVRWLDHAGQFGRTTFGGDGAEADAVILSKLTGKPVRVQWTLPDDLAWSTASPGWVADAKAALDANGRLVAVHTANYAPNQNDARPIGALLAGMPTGNPGMGGWVAVEWAYDKIPHRLEQVYTMPNVGADSAYGGLRGNIMRTPGQRQQNFVLEGLMTEAAAAAGVDPIEFRIRHTSNQRLIDILTATAKAAGWEPRPSPHPRARRNGSEPLMGRGVSIITRTNAVWAGIADVMVTPATGLVQVTKFTVGVECGKIINPRQLDRCMRGGIVMGLSETLKEEVTFDTSRVTSIDWSRYKILTMEEMPEISVVHQSRNDQGFGAGGEAPNAIPAPTIAAAFFDATGVHARRIPLTPEYVKTLLAT